MTPLSFFPLSAAIFLTAATGAFAQTTDLEQSLIVASEAGYLPGVHSTIVDFAGERLAEVYFDGEDEIWGTPIGVIQHGPDTLHDLRSVTKSVVGLLYGIALNDGLVPALDAPLLAEFPEYADLMDGGSREDITVEDALTMRMGTEWNENLPYSDPNNSEIAMELAPDRYRFVLDRPMQGAPGEDWVYNGGAVALLARLIELGAGMPIDEFAATRLFDPLGIDQFEWVRGADGVPSAASGLRMTTPDLARIANLVMVGGAFEGQQIVPADWLEQSLQVHTQIDDRFYYGYLWHVTGRAANPIVLALGNGGQRVTIQSRVDLTIVTLAGNYNQHDGWVPSLRVVLDHVVPDVQARLAE